jgi:MFS family permease
MRSKPMILVALLLAAFLVNLDTTLVNVALPALVRELHATTTQLQWVVDSYNLVFAALLLTFGSLSDRFGRKGMLLAGLVVVGAASLAGGFTSDPAQLIAARSVMGLGAAMTFPATLSLISNTFTDRRSAPSTGPPPGTSPGCWPGRCSPTACRPWCLCSTSTCRAAPPPTPSLKTMQSQHP